MCVVTVFRHVPPPIIGIIGTIHNHAFEAFEATLDWLETTGTLVERIEPLSASTDVRCYRAASELLAREGDACLPLVIVNERVASRGRLLSRAQLARAIGEACRAEPRPLTSDHSRSAA